MQISLEAAFYNFTIERQIEAKSLPLSPMAGIEYSNDLQIVAIEK
jgi:hypothetical protein